MPAIAPILAQGHGTIQFVVDAVEPYQSQLAGQFASSDWPDVVDLIHEGHEAPRSTETAKDAKIAKVAHSLVRALHPSSLCSLLDALLILPSAFCFGIASFILRLLCATALNF